VGEIGFDRHEFLYELSMWEIKAIIKGYRRRNKTLMESARLYTYYILCAQGAKIDSPEQLQKFTWDDEKRERQPISQEEVDELQALIASANKEIRNDSASETGAEDETN
jgi:hypothetical protein